MKNGKIVVNDLITSYQDNENGSKVVLCLHGWGDNSATFNNLANTMKDKFRVICVDLPGFGGTDSPDGVWGLDEYAKFVKSFTDKLGIEVYAVVGHSNGGAIAIRGIGNGDIGCKKLILLASAGVRDVYKGKKQAMRIMAKGAKLATKPLPKSVQQKLKRKAYDKIGSDLFVAEHLQETFKKVVTDDVVDDARKITVPTLLIYGSADTATPVAYGEKFNNSITGSKLMVLDGVGHAVHTEDPKSVNKLVEEFLK